MGFLDFLFKFRKDRLHGDTLKSRLFVAAAAGDGEQLTRLCRDCRREILDVFPIWQMVPEAVQEDPEQAQYYAHGLISVSQCFAQALGDSSLLEAMTGPPETNPMMKWDELVQQAETLMQQLAFAESADLLREGIAEVDGCQGSGVDRYLPVLLGRLGDALFQCGQTEDAIAASERALALCEDAGAQDGVTAYLGNLYEMHRYLGQFEPAAGYLERMGRSAQAQICRAGEPLLRVVAEFAGERYELDQLPTIRDGRVQFIFERNRIALASSSQRVAQGKEAGADHDFQAALALFDAAVTADPFDPDPHFQAGFTLLQLKRYSEAIPRYKQTEHLAPGWFHCRSDLYIAEQLATGHLDRVTWRLINSLQDGDDPPKKKVAAAEKALKSFPVVAPLHLHLGLNLQALGRDKEAAVAAHSGLGCVDEIGTQARLLLLLGQTAADADERRENLEAAVATNGDLVAAAAACVALANLAV
jgi:tetratricopeptide (TPR) repeat protein